MIVLDGVVKAYGATRRTRLARPPALDRVTLEFTRGAVHAVVGPNGAGKSTLFGLVLGFLHPTKGAVEIDGEEPRDFLAHSGAAYLPERFALPPEWRVRDALRYLSLLERGRDGDAAADHALEAMGLAPYADRRIGQLSRGLLQRTGIAQALLSARELVVLDEPTEGLDPIWRIRLRDEIARMCDAGRTVLIASHDLTEVERVADRVVMLGGGTVREIIDARAGDAVQRWVIHVERGAGALQRCFPDAEAVDAGDDAGDFLVGAADAADLSTRLAAFLDAGGIVASVRAAELDLERRVRGLGEGA
jgi:ABC-2 type transport system ATP-binding protein